METKFEDLIPLAGSAMAAVWSAKRRWTACCSIALSRRAGSFVRSIARLSASCCRARRPACSAIKPISLSCRSGSARLNRRPRHRSDIRGVAGQALSGFEPRHRSGNGRRTSRRTVASARRSLHRFGADHDGPRRRSLRSPLAIVGAARRAARSSRSRAADPARDRLATALWGIGSTLRQLAMLKASRAD